MTPKPLILTKPDGTQIDHIGLACADLEEGIRWFKDQTGIDPIVNPILPKLPFRNAVVRLGERTFLEILAPNTEHKRFHPLKSLLKRFKDPAIWFWYVSTDDFEKLETAIVEAGYCLERKSEAQGPQDTGPAYIGASVGPGFWPARPNVIQWKRDPEKHRWANAPSVKTQDFTVQVCHGKFESTKRFFENLGIRTSYLKVSDDEESYLSLTLDTPEKGLVTFRSQVETLGNWVVLKTVLKDLFGCL